MDGGSFEHRRIARGTNAAGHARPCLLDVLRLGRRVGAPLGTWRLFFSGKRGRFLGCCAHQGPGAALV